MMELNGKTLTVLGIWGMYILVTFVNYPQFAALISTSALPIALLIYLAMNPAYIALMYGVFSFGKKQGRKVWKRGLASVLIVLGFDLTAAPRLFITDSITSTQTSAMIGAIFMRAVELLIPHKIAYVIVYTLFPFLAIMASVELLGITNFIKEVKR